MKHEAAGYIHTSPKPYRYDTGGRTKESSYATL